jgi:hypothetical protein
MSVERFEDLVDESQNQAHESMLRAALFLVARARDRAEFPTDRDTLEPLLAEVSALVPSLRLAHMPPDPTEADWPDLDQEDPVLLVAPGDGVALELSCSYDRHRNLTATLHLDGRLTDEGFGVGFAAASEHSVQLDPDRQADLEEIGRQLHEKGFATQEGTPFAGDRFLRTITVQPQPNRPVQITSVDLYGDGLIANFVVTDPSEWMPEIPLQLYDSAGLDPPIEEFVRRAKEAGGNLIPSIRIEDDVGTEYRHAGGSGTGPKPYRGSATFTPVVPSNATELRVSTYAGAVAIRLSARAQ